MTLVEIMSFLLPITMGATGSLPDFFTRHWVVWIHHIFKEFVQSIGPTFETKEPLTCRIYQTEVGMNYDQVSEALAIPGLASRLDANVVCALLAFLGSDAGMLILGIPQGKTEVYVLLGCIEVNGTRYELLVNRGKKFELMEVIYLQARVVGPWIRDAPLVLVFG